MSLYSNLSIKNKIIYPLVLASIIGGIGVFFYFSHLYQEAKIDGLVDKARSIIVSAEAAREYSANLNELKLFKDSINDPEEFLKTVPVVSALATLEKKADILGFKAKAPKFSPRNPKNEPDAFEAEVLKNLQNGNIEEYWEIDEATNTLRFFRPVILTEDCLICHGDPANSMELWGNNEGKDITGAKMEGWKAGEVHGAFEIMMDMTPVNQEVRSRSFTIAGIASITILFIVFISIFIARSISKPIKELENISDKITAGDLDVLIKNNSKDEVGKLSLAYSKIVNTLKNLISEVNHVSNSAKQGKLDVRGDDSKFEGGFKQIVSGFNTTLDEVVSPLEVASQKLNLISQGIIPEKITDKRYLGIPAVDNVNILIDKLNLLLFDINKMIEYGVQGNFAARADVARHDGDYKKLMVGVNNMLDAILLPIEEGNRVLRKISGGDLSEKVKAELKGDHLEMKNAINDVHEWLKSLIEYVNSIANGNLNANLEKASEHDEIHQWLILMRENIKDVVADTNRIANAAALGNLSQRCATENYNGEFKNIALSVNKTLDSVTEPLNIAAEYIDKIAKGEVPEKITKDFNGEFNKIKVNLNICIDAISDLVADTALLIEAGKNGDLNFRANSGKHQGEFRNIIDGFNRSLDSVVNPINEVIEVMEKLAEGDLNYEVEGEYSGDILKLKNAVNSSIVSINNILEQVITTIEEVAAGSNQVADASNSLSQGATEQAASLEEITSSMAELSGQTRNNAESAFTAKDLTEQSKTNAQIGNSKMNELKIAMGDITKSSENISRIIKVIDEIAFQTNLLALNAAVEAARAGRHGKGFAVVAEEVRELAARSARAAKETSELIENSINTIEKGSELSLETNNALNKITESTNKVADIVREIAMLSDEQAMGFSQINEGLNQIDKVTQTNTASAEQSASASQELSSQATKLRNLVSGFNLRRNEMLYSRGNKLLR